MRKVLPWIVFGLISCLLIVIGEIYIATSQVSLDIKIAVGGIWALVILMFLPVVSSGVEKR